MKWSSVLVKSSLGSLVLTGSSIFLFPFDALSRRLEAEAASRGMVLSIESMGWSWRGIRASGIQLNTKPPAGTPLSLESLVVRPTLFPLGFRGRASSGSLQFDFRSDLNANDVSFELDTLNLQHPLFFALTNIDAVGTVKASAKLTRASKASPADWSKAKGSIDIQGSGVRFESIPLAALMPGSAAMMSSSVSAALATPINLEQLNCSIVIDGGKATTKPCELKGGDIEFTLKGEAQLNKSLNETALNFEAKLKIDEALTQKQPLLGAGLLVLKADPEDRAWRMGKLGGTWGRPQFP